MSLFSCLTVEKKEYTFEFNADKSGKLTIKFTNIMSVKDGEKDVSPDDYNELMNGYINGDKIEKEYKGAKVVKKQVFEKDGKFCGEVVLEFSNPAEVGLYRYSDEGPYMLCIEPCLDNETYMSSNGTYGGDKMPVVFWDQDFTVFSLTTAITTPDETTVSLLEEYKKANGL